MNKFLELSDSQRKSVYESVAIKVGLPAQVIEKDFWVTAILQTVFTLPVAKQLVFKGGTSLSKGWKLIERFSEDIDIAVDPIILGVPEGDLTKKQIKKLRKTSSLFVLEQLTPMICEEVQREGLHSFITVDAQPNGEGDNTYPEPRQIYLHYKSVFDKALTYLRPDVVLEVSARSLIEPTEPIQIKSILGEHLPVLPLTDSVIHTAIPAKTFLEKVFLLHELFSVPGHGMIAEHKSRHLYDLYVMMNKDFAKKAVIDDILWESIRHHREIYTSVRDIDYTPDVRKRLRLIPREDILDTWRADYDAMKESMIYGNKPSFDELLEGMSELQREFREIQ
ncbi:nucleotidyl transferase AbiEii/AbiGii toxin family protein [Hoylesella buccalis]|uniref:nucleotidyl transferase AbiEii/AbiGii toxin family protein n=1 Tax=Hoylesella buccalis TaxID=28127 RepID=UPI00288AEE4D|nr:nucleotidyl transferase AbiEii/AbiGii toxin family protein [Hoylesella buccalis]